ncbi:MAG: M56 family metallopeptidase, partial [Christiangramia sp.]|nr:M56 family metallopeptidase [Christiangramia sp.]
SVIFAFVLPLITFSYSVEHSSGAVTALPFPEMPGTGDLPKQESWMSYLGIFSLVIYSIGLIIMGYRFTKNLCSIQENINNNEHFRSWDYIYVLLKQKLIPHTFLNYIFLNKTEYENDQISESVIEHEKAHVDQGHSLDILFIEILQVIFWFNPVLIWLKRSVKLNHEFLADEQVLSKKTDALEYSNVLLCYSSDFHHNSLSSSISHSLIKKRIIMISKNFSLKRLLGRIGLLLPVLIFCIYFFNNNIVAKPVITTSTEESDVFFAEAQDPDIISIRLEEDRIFVNSEEVKLKEFSKHLDALVKARADAELKEMNFHVKTRKAEEGLLDLLNKEFEKTRFSRVTGHSVLPPPPPVPAERVGPPPAPTVPHTANDVPPPPPAPRHLNTEVPPPPPAPRRHTRKQDSLRRAHMNTRDEMREQMRMEREFHKEELGRKRAVHRAQIEQQRDSIRQQHEVAVRQRVIQRRAEIIQERARIREEREALHDENQRLKENIEKKKLIKDQKKKDSID